MSDLGEVCDGRMELPSNQPLLVGTGTDPDAMKSICIHSNHHSISAINNANTKKRLDSKRLNSDASGTMNSVIDKFRDLISEFPSQSAFAREAGLVQPHVSQILKGSRVLSPEICNRIESRLKRPGYFGFSEYADAQKREPAPIRLLDNPPLSRKEQQDVEEAIFEDIHTRAWKAGAQYVKSHPTIPTGVGIADADLLIRGERGETLLTILRFTNLKSMRSTENIILANAMRLKIAEANYRKVVVAYLDPTRERDQLEMRVIRFLASLKGPVIDDFAIIDNEFYPLDRVLT